MQADIEDVCYAHARAHKAETLAGLWSYDLFVNPVDRAALLSWFAALSASPATWGGLFVWGRTGRRMLRLFLEPGEDGSSYI